MPPPLPMTFPASGPETAMTALSATLERIAAALERLAPPHAPSPDLLAADAFVWQADRRLLKPVARVAHVSLALLRGIGPQQRTLLDNSRRFAAGLPANNALLWGARGSGKSSLVKAVHAQLLAERPGDAPALVEIQREDLPSLPDLLDLLRAASRRCILFCDDLSFAAGDSGYKSLKAVLEGGVEGRPANVLFYATSNRRHLMPREMIENERATAIDPGEAVEENVSLSDRFGLWLGFYACDQATFFSMIEGYMQAAGLHPPPADWQAQATAWAAARGARSGRVAWQFTQDLAARHGREIF